MSTHQFGKLRKIANKKTDCCRKNKWQKCFGSSLGINCYVHTYILNFELLLILTFFFLQNGDTALHIAAAMGRRKLTRVLLESGCNKDVKNKVCKILKPNYFKKQSSSSLFLII